MALDWNKPLETSSGYSAVYLRQLNNGSQFNRLVMVTDDKGYESIRIVSHNGKNFSSNESNFDILNAPAKKVVYFNIYKNPDGNLGLGPAANSLAHSKDIGGPEAVGRVRVEFVEGKFDE